MIVSDTDGLLVCRHIAERQVTVSKRQPMGRIVDIRSSAQVVGPAYLDAFVGRLEEVRWILDDLESGHRLLTVVGPPGVGKTRLAGEICKRHQASHTHFVQLTQCRDTDSLLSTFLHSVGADATATEATDRARVLARVLSFPEPALVVLDYCTS